MEKYYNENGDVGVLVAPGWGAGWSSWNGDIRLAVDKRIIEKWLEGTSEDDMREYLESIGYRTPCIIGYEELTLQFVPKGSQFMIDEHDGFETIVFVDSEKFITV